MMRTRSSLDALFNSTRQGLLAATVVCPERKWYFRELARRLQVRPSTIQRELSQLVEAGILQRSEDGNRVYYQANTASPIFPELQGLFLKTVGLVDILRRALEPVAKKMTIAFVHGSTAAGDSRQNSDIDMIIVGDVGLADVAPLLRGARAALGRELNTSVYHPREFKKQLEEPSHFLSTVLSSPLIFAIGAQSDLERLIKSSARKAPPDRTKGGSRPSRRRRA